MIPRLWNRYRRMPIWAQVLIAFFAFVLIIGPFTDDKKNQRVTAGSTWAPGNGSSTTASRATSTAPKAANAAAWDNTTVSRVIDGDTLVVASGLRVRLIGVDSPEISGGVQCFGPEATDHLAKLIPVGTEVRLVYDTGRLDRYGRTLAYLYRTSDGLFVNTAMALDGYAVQLTVAPNVSHADEFQAAVAAARSANRGLWSACQSSSGATGATTPMSPIRPAPGVPRGTTAPVTIPVGGCHPFYSGACVPIASDVDCAGGGGNGPAYVSEKDFNVVGPDVYGLDANNDKVACQSR